MGTAIHTKTAQIARVAESSSPDAIGDDDEGQIDPLEMNSGSVGPSVADEDDRPICHFCGAWIEEKRRCCPVLDDGRWKE